MLNVTQHKFVRGNAPTPYNSLLWSIFKLLKKPSSYTNIRQLCQFMIYYFGGDRTIDKFLFNIFTKFQLYLKYGDAAEIGSSLHESELEALSGTYETLICIISLYSNDKEEPVSWVVYGQCNSKATKYICILYDEEKERYDPLYVVNKQNPEIEKQTIFERNDQTARKLLDDFIGENFGCNLDLGIYE